MLPRLPALLISLLAIVCTALLLAGFRYGLRRTTLPPQSQRRASAFIAIAAVLWFLLVGWLAHSGFFSNFTAHPPRLLFALLFPALVLAVASFTSRSLPAALQQTPIAWLLYLQVFRVFVELILWRGYGAGAIPVQMTFAGRNFDILAGLTAPLAGWLWQRTHNRLLGIVWNIAGLLLLPNIVVIAILFLPTPLRVFPNGPANTLLTQFPFIFLPAVLVPLAYTAHILSLRQLRSSTAPYGASTR